MTTRQVFEPYGLECFRDFHALTLHVSRTRTLHMFLLNIIDNVVPRMKNKKKDHVAVMKSRRV